MVEMLQRTVTRACSCLLTVVLLTGCRLPGADRLEQCRAESEQLLSDYRLQRDRAERLELENRTLNEQIAAVEKKLALASNAGDTRLASRPDGPAAEQRPQPSPNAIRPSAEATAPAAEAEEGSSTVSGPLDNGWRSIPRP